VRAPPPRRVVVIGAGLAGLAAAHALAREEIAVTLLEARSAGACVRAQASSALSSVPRSAPALLGLALELGLARPLRLLPFRVGDSRAPGTNRARELGSAAAAFVNPLERLRARRLRRLLREWGARLDPMEPEQGARFDDRSAADFCRLYLGSGPRAQRLLGSLELGFGLDPRELSRLALLLLLDPWGEIGMAAVVGLAGLREALASQQKDLRYGIAARAVHADARAVVLDSGERVAADAVVLATAPPSAARLVDRLSPAERWVLERASALNALALRVCVRGVPGPALREEAGVTGLLARGPGALAGIADITALVADAGGGEGRDRDRSARSSGAGERQLLLRARAGFAAAASELPDAECTRRLLAEAERLCPGLSARAEGHQLARESAALPMLRVGCFRNAARLRSEATRRPERPLYWACAPRVGPHPEAALAAGLRAADECLLRLPAARS
jgi:glycine/D-amino acid oxidase-like deaminating enzyme